MEEIKVHFKTDNRSIGLCWFLIDTDGTLAMKINHVACISCHGGDISYQGFNLSTHNLKYISADDKLTKPTISNYINASCALIKKGFVFNKKKGTLEERKTLRH